MSEIQALQWDDVPNLMALVKQFAIKMVAPHVVPEGEGRFPFPLNGEVHYLPKDAPVSAICAAEILTTASQFTNAYKEQNIRDVAIASFTMGIMSASNLLPADKKGRRVKDVLEAIQKGGRPRALDDDEVKFVKRKFAERKGAGKKVTNNAAVMHALRAINKTRAVPVTKSTIERAVGIRP